MAYPLLFYTMTYQINLCGYCDYPRFRRVRSCGIAFHFQNTLRITSFILQLWCALYMSGVMIVLLSRTCRRAVYFCLRKSQYFIKIRSSLENQYHFKRVNCYLQALFRQVPLKSLNGVKLFQTDAAEHQNMNSSSELL